MKVLVVSNGFGEDQIACNLIRALHEIDFTIDVLALPIVGDGGEYKRNGIRPVLEQPMMPSGGFVRNTRDLIKDLMAGSLKQHLAQIKKIKELGPEVDFVLAVGDVFCLVMAGYFIKKPTYFIPTAKSDLIQKHTTLETWAIRKLAKKVFTRDAVTAKSLKEDNINAVYKGNAMMDNLTLTGETFGLKPTEPVVTLLPGSRQEALLNLLKILDVVQHMTRHHRGIRFLLALAATFTPDDLSKTLEGSDWELRADGDAPCIKHRVHRIYIRITHQFTDAVSRAWAVIGLAGTANEQAIHLGKPVITFEGSGPQSRLTRFLEQRDLLGPNLKVVDPFTPIKAASLVLKQVKRMNIKYRSPLDTLPEPGKAALEIAEAILDHH